LLHPTLPQLQHLLVHPGAKVSDGLL
jgi:hypothetical protein